MSPHSAKASGQSLDQDWLPLIYDELRRVAEVYLKKERGDHTLQPTALVHEAYIKLAAQAEPRWRDAGHFQAVAAGVMRQVLIDHARHRSAQKRGGNWLRITFEDATAVASQQEVDLLALDEAMQELESLDDRKCRIVEMRFYGGMTCEQIARRLTLSPKTVEADWYMARAWLRRKLAETSP